MRLLNFALPIAYGIGVLLGMYVYLAAAKILVLIGLSESVSILLGGWIAFFSILGVAFAIAKRQVTSPKILSRKSVIGHYMLAVGNVAATVTTVVPLSIAYVSGHTDYGLFTWFAIPVFLVNLILWPLGWKFATSSHLAID